MVNELQHFVIFVNRPFDYVNYVIGIVVEQIALLGRRRQPHELLTSTCNEQSGTFVNYLTNKLSNSLLLFHK